MSAELTPAEVALWWKSANVWNSCTVDGKIISAADIQAYIAKLEQRVMRLAAKLADQA